jgi:hypothetical protein
MILIWSCELLANHWQAWGGWPVVTFEWWTHVECWRWG